MTPRMFSSTRKCWPSDFLGSTVTAARRRPLRSHASRPRALRAPRRALRRALGSCGRRWPARSDVPRTGCGARYGLSVSTRIRSAGIAAAASRRSRRLRVGRVARERHVVPPLDGERRRAPATRSSGGPPFRRTARARPPSRRRPRGCGSTTGSSQLVREREMRVEEPALLRRRREAAGPCRGPSPLPRPPSDVEGAREARRFDRPRARPPGADRCRAPRTRPRGGRRRRARRDSTRCRCRS